MYILRKIASRIIAICKFNRIIYKCSRSKKIIYDKKMVNEARAFLERHSPNPQTSCICKNTIDPQVDIHIIIPAYNVERYIEDCMNSAILNATKKYSFLITVINDGSTDETRNLLRRYEEHPCVEVITQTNKGFSGARNTGLSYIKGKYVLFVDSDDMMDWHGVEKMMDAAIETGADIVSGSYTYIFANGIKFGFKKSDTGKLDTTNLYGYPWAKLYRAELFSDVCFPEKYWFEDSIFAQIIFPRISFAYGISENTYYYRNHHLGITNQSITKAKSIDSYWITEQLFKDSLKYGIEITEKYYNYILKMVKMTLRRNRFQPVEVQKGIFILFCDLIDQHFSKFHTNDDDCKQIERLIKARDLGKCISYSKWI